MILSEKIFKIGILKVCGIDFKDSLLCRQRSATATAVVQTTLPYTLKTPILNFFLRISSVYVWNIILNVTERFVTHDTA